MPQGTYVLSIPKKCVKPIKPGALQNLENKECWKFSVKSWVEALSTCLLLMDLGLSFTG